MEDELVSRRNIYIVLEDVNMIWDEDDIIQVERMYRAGQSAKEIAAHFKRQEKEIVVALLDRVTDWNWEQQLRAKASRAKKTSSKLTKEQYLDYKRCGLTDLDICAEERMGPATLVERKKKWGLFQKRGGDPRKKRFELLGDV